MTVIERPITLRKYNVIKILVIYLRYTLYAINYKQGQPPTLHSPRFASEMEYACHKCASCGNAHSGNSERTDPHKRSAQLDFFEKILGVCAREHAVAPRRQPRRRGRRSAGEIKAGKTRSRRKQMRRDEGRRPRTPGKETKRFEEKEEVDGELEDMAEEG